MHSLQRAHALVVGDARTCSGAAPAAIPQPRRAGPCGRQPRQSVVAASYSGSARRPAGSFGANTIPPPPPAFEATRSREDLAKRAAQLNELVQETVNVTISTGPRGFFRALQAADSLSQLAREYIQRREVDATPVFLRKLFEKLGATYIKLGQFIASSPSLFPDEYVLEFQKCLDKAEAVPFATIERIVNQELNQPWQNVFSSIDPVPLASASVAQVHCAVLKSSNKQVVIKVLKVR